MPRLWRWRMRIGLSILPAIVAPGVLAAQDYRLAFNSFGPANTEIFLADANGANPRPVFADPALDYTAAFSSDGVWLIFTSERAGSADIYRARLDGSGLERIVDHPAFDDQAVRKEVRPPSAVRLRLSSTQLNTAPHFRAAAAE